MMTMLRMVTFVNMLMTVTMTLNMTVITCILLDIDHANTHPGCTPGKTLHSIMSHRVHVMHSMMSS